MNHSSIKTPDARPRPQAVNNFHYPPRQQPAVSKPGIVRRGTFAAAACICALAVLLAACGNPLSPEPDPDRYAITMDFSRNPDFGTAAPGYALGEDTSLTVTITNTGNKPTGQLTVSLKGTGKGSFTLSNSSETGQTIAIADIPAEGTAEFTVAPVTGLAEESTLPP